MAKFLMTHTAYIHEDVIFDYILPKLPLKSILRYKRVSKSWKRYIETSNFIHTHLKQSLKSDTYQSTLLLSRDGLVYDLDTLRPRIAEIPVPPAFRMNRDLQMSLRVIATCNGIVLFKVGWHDRYYLWNPIKPEAFRFLKFDHIMPDSDSDWEVKGFGYDEYSAEYKLVLNCQCRISGNCGSFVYCLGADSWKAIPAPPCDLFYSARLNNSLHRLHIPSHVDVGRIVVFNLHDEVWSPMSLSEEMDLHFMHLEPPSHLSVYNGSISMLKCEDLIGFGGDNNLSFGFWVMKEYGVKKSWTKLFRLSSASTICNVLFSGTHCKVATEPRGRGHLELHSDRHDEIEVTEIQLKRTIDNNRFIELVGSLVSVFDVGKKA